MDSDRMRTFGSSIVVGDYITTDKPSDVWWKVEAVAEDRDRGGMRLLRYRFAVVNRAGYRKELIDTIGAGRRFYRWIPAELRS